jgi:hypothetical protein
MKFMYKKINPAAEYRGRVFCLGLIGEQRKNFLNCKLHLRNMAVKNYGGDWGVLMKWWQV